MTLVEILVAAKEKIADPMNWTREAYARPHSDSNVDPEYGPREVEPKSAKACAWCSAGALVAVDPNISEMSVDETEAYILLSSVAGRDIVHFNDENNHD